MNKRLAVDFYREGWESAAQGHELIRDGRRIFNLICKLNGLKPNTLNRYREFGKGWIAYVKEQREATR